MNVNAKEARPGGKAGSTYGVDVALRVDLDLVDKRRDTDVFNKAEAQGHDDATHEAADYLDEAAEQH